jgi:hypothetical protein
MTSRSFASSNAVHPAVCESGPVQMWRKMQDPRPFVGGVALYPTITPILYCATSRMCSALFQSTCGTDALSTTVL